MNTSTSQVEGSSSAHGKRAERRVSPSLAAYHWRGTSQRRNSVRDISSSGAFLLTQDRWEPGEVIALTLQRNGPPEKENGFPIHAKAVRWDDQGVAVSFLLPPGADLRLWQSPLKSASEQNEPEDILREFRIAQATSFLARITPEIKESMSKVLHEELSNYRLENAIEIALKAEKMLGAAVEADHLRALPHVVKRVIEGGSWSDDKWMLQFWAGLLAASCTNRSGDESTLGFVDLLSQLKALHMRILSAASNKGTKLINGSGNISSRPLKWTAADLMKVSGSHDLIKLDRELNYMADIGVIASRERSAFFQQMTDTSLAPTALGLELYARCNGYRGSAQGFYGVGLTLAGALALEQ
jgi:hypothetical protein